jgi:hypothetical protein
MRTGSSTSCRPTPLCPALHRRALGARPGFGAGGAVEPVEAGRRGRPCSEGLGGFCLLYPSFCSLEAAPIRVLNDLYVRPIPRPRLGSSADASCRRQRRQAGCARLDLSTAHTNHTHKRCTNRAAGSSTGLPLLQPQARASRPAATGSAIQGTLRRALAAPCRGIRRSRCGAHRGVRRTP